MAQPRFPGHRQFRYNFDIVIPPLQNPSEEDCATHSQLYNVMKIDGRIKVIEIAGQTMTRSQKRVPKFKKQILTHLIFQYCITFSTRFVTLTATIF